MTCDHLSHRVVISPSECDDDNPGWGVVPIDCSTPWPGRTAVALEAGDGSLVIFGSPEAIERFALTLFLAISAHMEAERIEPISTVLKGQSNDQDA